jgi:hypothetical protein
MAGNLPVSFRKIYYSKRRKINQKKYYQETGDVDKVKLDARQTAKCE